ncbi:hypothetical protein [Geothrix oryzisoli]|uniref:hypothetical protein n=1 Tax=Geothrix oryzisoli TaxID=2922721 RepID=UPI001FAD3628|nr:hypothetical protein [Geothrix oryzisoli]
MTIRLRGDTWISILLVVNLGCGPSKFRSTTSDCVRFSQPEFQSTLARLRSYRSAASRVARYDRPLDSASWIVPFRDPMAILCQFSSIHLNETFTLVAYDWGPAVGSCCHPCGFTKVYGIHRGITLRLSPLATPNNQRRFPPQPAEPLNLPNDDPAWFSRDYMSLLAGDLSLKSYFEASLFRLEIQDFPGTWDQADAQNLGAWNFQHILWTSPSHYRFKEDQFEEDLPQTNPAPLTYLTKAERLPSGWTWVRSAPTDWHPKVCRSGGDIVVEFFTYTAQIRQRIIHYEVTFSAGQYSPKKWKRQVIAEGRDGWQLS